MADLLATYQEYRRQHPVTSSRDWIASRLGNAVLSIASPAYRKLVFEAIHKGLVEIAASRRPQPFTEPADECSCRDDHASWCPVYKREQEADRGKR